MLRYLSLLLLLVVAAPLLADEVTTTEGDTFVGKFEKLEKGEVHFTTDSIGLVKIPIDKVDKLHLDEPREIRVRTSDNIKDQQNATLRTEDGDVIIELEAGELDVASLSGIKGIDETLPDERAKWDVSVLGTLAWTEGNTRTYALGLRFDIKRETKHNWMTLFGRGSYFQDRNLEEDPVRERKYHFGYHYRYVFDFNLTIDFTEDLYFDEFAAYHYRSVTGLGPGYYIFREENLSWHVGAHLTYTYEDQMNGAEDRGYLGARLMTEFDWKSPSGSLHVNYKGQLNFDFDETKNLTASESLLIEHKFLTYFTAGLLIVHDWDNLPPPKIKHHDFRFMVTLGFSWSGRGF